MRDILLKRVKGITVKNFNQYDDQNFHHWNFLY